MLLQVVPWLDAPQRGSSPREFVLCSSKCTTAAHGCAGLRAQPHPDAPASSISARQRTDSCGPVPAALRPRHQSRRGPRGSAMRRRSSRHSSLAHEGQHELSSRTSPPSHCAFTGLPGSLPCPNPPEDRYSLRRRVTAHCGYVGGISTSRLGAPCRGDTGRGPAGLQ